jgi:superfamily II DNA/RNA helicase
LHRYNSEQKYPALLKLLEKGLEDAVGGAGGAGAEAAGGFFIGGGAELGSEAGAEAAIPPRIIVFLSSKAKVDGVTRRLRNEGFPALSIHGGGDCTSRMQL